MFLSASSLTISLLSGFRFGEAANPAPAQQDMASAATFVLGCAGINNKAMASAELPWGIWNVAETQASCPTFKRWMSRSTLACLHGEYAPLRACSWGCADNLQAVPLPWRGASYLSGRIILSSFQLLEHQCLGACVYAPLSGPTYGRGAPLTDNLFCLPMALASLLGVAIVHLLRWTPLTCGAVGVGSPGFLHRAAKPDAVDVPTPHG